jgi:hypothetical protein
MALLYPWATKEYLLWEMSLGQIVAYHNVGIHMKYGKPEKNKSEKLSDMSKSELKAYREEMRRLYGDIG